jgi:1-aminocyclopropane-1-carboxylate deaminase/D-cysteine desulfhydrase-like pyridoxal-dependent ACC family enzyme
MPQSIADSVIPNLRFNIPTIQHLKDQRFEKENYKIDVLRLDEIHHIISGNKLFKLKYFLKEAINSPHKQVITFGGAYSNHLAATALACRKSGLKCTGFVRGEKPKVFSPTLVFCVENGMSLQFLSREESKKIDNNSFIENLEKQFGSHTLIPEGGFSINGAKGAEEICSYFNSEAYTHICLALGTATTFAGIINGVNKNTAILGFPVLKNLGDVAERLQELKVDMNKAFSVIGDYHFGGYAKKNETLISFMNDFYDQQNIPLDFVYTAKMMFGVYDLVKKMYFPPSSKILCIHTGGLQGNSSLKKGTLHF